eukprot:s5632_g3.t1
MLHLGMGVNFVTRHGDVPLTVAAACAGAPDHPERVGNRPAPYYFVQSLLEAGAAVNAFDRDGDTALTLATTTDDFHLCADIDAPDPMRAAIVEAARCNHWDAAMLLGDHGADLSGLGPHGREMLRRVRCDRRCRQPCAETRCRATRVVGSRTRAGDVARRPQGSGDEALWGELGTVPERPLRASDRPEPLYFVKSLLEVGASVDFADVDGETALVVAVRANDTALARLLLDQTADPNVASGGGAPLQLAAGGNSVEMIRLLLSARADVDGPEPGQAPIMEAARGNHWEATFCLWHHGADALWGAVRGDEMPSYEGGGQLRASGRCCRVAAARRGDEAPWGKRWA